MKSGKTRIIFIQRFTVYSIDNEMYQPGTDGFFLFGMGQFIAKEFMSRGYPLSFEIWRMDTRITAPMEKLVDGIKCRIFPSLMIRGYGEYSRRILLALRAEAKNPETVFHFMPNHPLNFQHMARLVRHSTVVATHLGGSNPYWEYKHGKKTGSYIRYLMEKYFLLKSFDHFFTMSKEEAEYLGSLNRPVSHMPIFGISRAERFFIKDRSECRARLGLPLDKTILLQVGRAVPERGFDWVMDLIDHYLPDHSYLLLFAGISESDACYHELKGKGVTIVPYLPQSELPDYYNAADLLYYLPHGEMDLAFAGTSYVPLEALACGTPVIATTMHHFPGDEIWEVARKPKSREDVVPMIEEMLASNVSRERCREIVMEKFSWDKILGHLHRIYKGSE